MKTWVMLSLCLTMAIGACTSSRPHIEDDVDAPQASRPQVMRITPDEFLAQRSDEAVILDVRTPEEFRGGHLANAINMDVKAAGFQESIQELDRSRTYYLYCRSGNRSGQAGEIMEQMGFTSLFNIGGLAELERAGAVVVHN